MNQQLLIIWSVLLFSQVVYLIVPAPSHDETMDVGVMFPLVLGFVALIQSIGIVVWMKVRAFDPIGSGKLDPESTEGLMRLTITLMVAWTLAESVSIYGLVLRFMGFDWIHVMPFAVAGAVLLYMGRPWQSKLKRSLTSSERATSSAPIR